MWLNKYFNRRKIDKLEIKRARAHAELVVYSKNTYYQSEKQEVARLSGEVAALDEKLNQLNHSMQLANINAAACRSAKTCILAPADTSVLIKE